MKKPITSAVLSIFMVSVVFGIRVARGPIPALTVEPARTKGPLNAPVSLTVFSDFQCPYCKEIEPTLAALSEAFPTDLKIIFKQYPLKMHDHAQALAEASECAADQGKFWEFHDEVFKDIAETYPLKKVDRFVGKMALQAKLDIPQFYACFESGTKKEVIEANKKEAKNVLLSGTPTLLLNGTKIMASFKLEDLKAEIEKELARTKKS